MKKGSKLTILGTSALMLLSVIGCAGGGSDDGHTIIFWSTFNDSYQNVINNAKTSFEAKYKNLGYKVSIKKQTGSYNDIKDLVVKGVSTQNIPDLCVVYPDSVADFIQSKVAFNVQTYMESEQEIEVTSAEGLLHTEQIGWTNDDFEDIPETYIEEGQHYTVQGTFSLPFCKSTEAMYYNGDILNGLDLTGVDDTINNGQPLDKDYLGSLTWDELFNRLCPALIEYNNGLSDNEKIMKPCGKYNKTAVVGWHSDDNLFITLAEQFGLGYTAIENYKGVVKFVEKNADNTFKDVGEGWYDLIDTFAAAYKNGYITTTGALGESASNLYQGGTQGSGMLFSIGSTGGAKYAYDANNAKNSVPVMIPQADTAHAKVINQGPSMAFLKRNKGTAEEIQARTLGAWLFYKELLTTEVHLNWALQTGYTPVRDTVAESDEYLAYCNENLQPANSLEKLSALTAKYATTVADSLFSNVVYYGSSKARTAVGRNPPAPSGAARTATSASPAGIPPVCATGS